MPQSLLFAIFVSASTRYGFHSNANRKRITHIWVGLFWDNRAFFRSDLAMKFQNGKTIKTIFRIIYKTHKINETNEWNGCDTKYLLCWLFVWLSLSLIAIHISFLWKTLKNKKNANNVNDRPLNCCAFCYHNVFHSISLSLYLSLRWCARKIILYSNLSNLFDSSWHCTWPMSSYCLLYDVFGCS